MMNFEPSWRFEEAENRWDLTPSDPFQGEPEELRGDRSPKPLRDAIERKLQEVIQGEVRFDNGSRALYATDGSNYRQVPIGVVIPLNTEDVIQTLRVARLFNAPVLSRGGGTSLAGQCCNTAIILDFSKYMNQLLSIDSRSKTARVQPGLILDHLRQRCEKEGLTFGPDPSTHTHCTLGGMIGNDSCGVHALMAGRTAENVHELDIVTYDGLRMRVGPTSEEELEKIIQQGGRRGEIYGRLKALRDKYAELIRTRYPRIPRRISGYNLDELLPENGFNVARALVGTESTCVIVLEATVRLVDWPAYRSILILGYPDIFSTGDHVTEILRFKPIGLEALDDKLVEYSVEKKLHPHAFEELPEGRGWLIAEFGGHSKTASDAKLAATMAVLKTLPGTPTMKWYDSKPSEERIWKIRESGLGATARLPTGQLTWEGWEDSAVPPGKEGEYLRELEKIFKKFGFEAALYGHFGQGCIHTRIPFDLFSKEGIRQYRHFMDEATDLVIRMGGSFSGEHGDGQSRAEFLYKMYGDELIQAFREFKSIWDPQGKMNPGKKVDPFPIDTNLRLGPDYRPAQPKTHFKFTDDNGSFSSATLRCVGIGKCRRTENGVMCPSFMATREEKHSTRGRAHLLFEMLTGDVLQHGWENEAVKEALDLCLACKGCKKECPVNVDMATYKAEFLSHYYTHRPRPRTAYTMGLIDQWARIGSRYPHWVNFFTQTPLLRDFAKQIAGITPHRQIPPLALRPFKDRFFERAKVNDGRPRALLWADTFNNYFHADTAMAAVEVLEAAGFQVIVPRQHLCCGRPLYDFGILTRAKNYLRQILRVLSPAVRAGIPIVGLEPSCLAVFKDELLGLFPEDRDALRLAQQCFMLGDFLKQKAPNFNIPKLYGRAIVQRHCHHQSVLGFDGDRYVLEQTGLDFELLDSGCCGMAGSFGFEAEAGRYDVSMKVGERVLLPRVRGEKENVIIVANGFSCREQIRQGGGRQALHLSEVVQRAIQQGTKRTEEQDGEQFGYAKAV